MNASDTFWLTLKVLASSFSFCLYCSFQLHYCTTTLLHKYKNEDVMTWQIVSFYSLGRECYSQKKVKDDVLVLSTYCMDILKTYLRSFRSHSIIYCTPSRKNNNRKTKHKICWNPLSINNVATVLCYFLSFRERTWEDKQGCVVQQL